MKRFILGTVSTVLLSTTIAPMVQAQVTPEAMPADAETLGMAVTPFNLVYLAYQGFFESEGIPKFNGLATGYRQGDVTAESLVKVAVSMRRLAPDTVNDRSYLAAVEHQLNSLTRNTSDN
ncbi:MAG: hypothetical protein KME11_21250 [Timaviella obliquedivisa GSE-PSE-MK23-08B]|jgi:hypothetical protein|nr:hypothetical protein [Timaviella obliquedivisa GSE-PSE-MK23-08B]